MAQSVIKDSGKHVYTVRIPLSSSPNSQKGGYFGSADVSNTRPNLNAIINILSAYAYDDYSYVCWATARQNSILASTPVASSTNEIVVIYSWI